MLNQILHALSALNIEHFIVEESNTETAELFFIRKNLDMRRIKDAVKYNVTVMHDFSFAGHPMRGSSSAFLYPGMTGSEVEDALKAAYNAASFVKNPAFELYAGKKEDLQPEKTRLADCTLQEIAGQFAQALFAADTRSDAFLNSAELFAKRTQVHILTSAGSDVRYVKTGCSGEFVVQCREPKDVEQYFSFSYEDADTEMLTKKVADALNTVCDRANASRNPKAGTYDVVLTGDHISTLLNLYLSRSNASAVFAHYSDYQVGTAIQGENVAGEKLNIRVLPSAPYANDGVSMQERDLAVDGKLSFIHGPTRFCRYLGIEPVGSYRRIRLDNGTVPFEEMKKNCLYPVSFSDFQMDPMSGHFGGEIRLAYLYTDSGVEILTGGSINGSLLEKHNDLTFSTERYSDANYSGPFAVKLKAVPVSGE